MIPLVIFRHEDVIKWRHFPRYWPSARGIHRSPVNSSHKGQWGGGVMFSWIWVWINGWVNNREAGDLRRYGAHYDVSVMFRNERQYDGLGMCTFSLWLVQWSFIYGNDNLNTVSGTDVSTNMDAHIRKYIEIHFFQGIYMFEFVRSNWQ